MYNDCGLDISKMSSFKRFLIVAQKTSKATFNAARSAIKTTMEQNRQRAETQEQQRVSFTLLDIAPFPELKKHFFNESENEETSV